MNDMANILRNIIRNNSMPLAQLYERIDAMYISGRITGEERTELIELMHSKANPSNEVGDYKELYEALVLKYNELAKRVEAIESRFEDTEEPEIGDDMVETYPEWQPWDGVSAGYQRGDIVMHNGVAWENMLETMANVWEPGAPGIDERYWKQLEQM